MNTKDIGRREFVKLAGISAVGISSLGFSNLSGKRVTIVCDSNDKISGSVPVQWAAGELQQKLADAGISVSRYESLSQVGENDLVIVAAGSGSPVARQLLSPLNFTIPEVPEVLGIVPLRNSGQQILLACGHDVRGLVYALLELTDQVHYSESPFETLNNNEPVIERPANKIRSNNRLFVSEVEDKPWFYDKEMWREYLSMLATQRFNRFNLSFGIGYDFLQNVTDAYFLFAYPFLLQVPGYKVRVPELPDAERDRNLEMLRFISSETVARGVQFQLGIWMHGYKWLNSPNPNYTIAGLTPETHGPYCRDALRELLKACPDISGITFRIHGESGVTEGSYNFWKTVFDGVATCSRKVEIDMHAKGMNQNMIDVALGTGMPVNISPKYWAEHLGMPYHQTDIRKMEIPKSNAKATGLMNLSSGSRSFMRYGYGDLLKEERPYGVLHRIWPGTQRLLLWGDPGVSAAHSRNFSFCGSAGVEMMEPLSFKGRRGSGIAGGRCGYSDASLKPHWDWQKYLYSFRVFGRLAYNPETKPVVWQRFLKKQFGAGANAVEAALGNATRILPVVLATHAPSAGNNTYWPEMYTNQSISDPEKKNPYYDTPSPKVFGNVSPLDPQLFLGINEFAKELLKGERSGKYTPVEYAQWIEDYADEAEKCLAVAASKTKGRNSPEYRRMEIDTTMQIGLGRFFGAKFRSGVLYGIFEQTGDRDALENSLELYRKVRKHWFELATQAGQVYQKDITVGENPEIRGHWLDRLPDIDEDIAFMSSKLSQVPVSQERQKEEVRLAIQEVLGRPVRDKSVCQHIQPEKCSSGKPIELAIGVEEPGKSVRLYYRHVDQAERFESVEMTLQDKKYKATISGEYTDSEYPLQYYFEIRERPDKAWLYPGFNDDLMNRPYFVAHKEA